jgi:hypothetical protein
MLRAAKKNTENVIDATRNVGLEINSEKGLVTRMQVKIVT